MTFKPTRIERHTDGVTRILGMLNAHGIYFESFGDLLIVSSKPHTEDLTDGFSTAIAVMLTDTSHHAAENLIASTLNSEKSAASIALSNLKAVHDFPDCLAGLCDGGGYRSLKALEQGEILHSIFDHMLSQNPSAPHTSMHTIGSNSPQGQGGEPIAVEVTSGCDGLALTIGGYDTLTASAPILLEHYEGSLRLVVWSDSEQEDHTHIISLDDLKQPPQAIEPPETQAPPAITITRTRLNTTMKGGQHLTDDDKETLEYVIACYGFLMTFNTPTSLPELAELMTSYYDNERTRVMARALIEMSNR